MCDGVVFSVLMEAKCMCVSSNCTTAVTCSSIMVSCPSIYTRLVVERERERREIAESDRERGALLTM